MKMIEKVASGIAKYHSTMPYSVEDNPRGEFRWQDYQGEAQAAIDALGVIVLPEDAEAKYGDLILCSELDQYGDHTIYVAMKDHQLDDGEKVLLRNGCPVVMEG